MREIVLDTETTGLSPDAGHRIVEIGCIELVNHVPSGEAYHCYINPRRPMPAAAFDVHGLSDEFLADKPEFREIVEDFLAFISDDRLIIHNAAFDLSFINAAFAELEIAPVPPDRATDTLMLARDKYPAASNSLDALCRRFGIDTSKRDKHGALVDCELLADVYLELIGGRQTDMTFGGAATEPTDGDTSRTITLIRPQALAPRLTDAERDAHRRFVETLGSAPLWNKYTTSR